MKPESSTTRYFTAAVQQLLAQHGHGAQIDLARRAKMSASYLNDLLSGRKPYWPDATKEKIAAVFGFSIAELLEIGEHYVRDGAFWPHGRHVACTAAKSIERMVKIFQLAAKDVGLHRGMIVFTAETIPAMLPQLWEDYRGGSIPDAKIYSEAIHLCKEILGR